MVSTALSAYSSLSQGRAVLSAFPRAAVLCWIAPLQRSSCRCQRLSNQISRGQQMPLRGNRTRTRASVGTEFSEQNADDSTIGHYSKVGTAVRTMCCGAGSK